LGAIEQVGQRLEADWSQHFSDRLSGPDGLELVVEVAHDLRSPLTSILFLAETLQRARSGPVNPVQERQLGLIYSAAFGLSSVASDVIELARGGDRLVDLDPIPFSVTDILESVRDIVQPIAEEKSLSVQLTTPEADFRIGHPVALSRVLLNLTTNALKFTAEGFVEVTARETGPRAVEFSVRDTGRGIPPQSMATLYEPFRRRQKPGEYAFSGSGLGLSICRKLVEAMGSALEVETAPGYGTRFHFVLDLPLAGEAQFG
jgi:signal transduction histidine kinase